ncbi:ncs1 nucleoside transporter family protein [Colletotrichum karsti]|uniref:Ncs1 nucleoside transporter family protein n=1 Tax=Colletotrichum karsti TaxID=1095194 RepID=A0A9P6I9S4_9PEZI|nr:ncs1 nucleoside transporter family protein [Colletotrichum karsti]KAF9878854.1 ncs1 nucleoside transporter family protein [Colletotrichum karsti]
MGLQTVLQRVGLPFVSRWINDDIRPIESRRRTWGFLMFHNFWLLVNCNITTYLTGSALIPLGLTWWQALICIVLGNLIATGVVIINSLPGSYYHLGFPVYSRAVWGMWGSQFVIWNRIFLSLVWYGFTAWVGGECIYLILLSWDPRLESHVPNTMPTDTGMTTAQFVSYILFCVISLPVLWIRPHRLEKFFRVACSITLVFFLVLLIWALATMGPTGFGDTITSGSVLPNTGGPQSVAWLMIYGIVSTIGSIAAGILNQNDYSRFATQPKHAILGQAVSFPFYGIFSSLIGILVTAATQHRFGGEAIWNPPTLFAQLLAQNETAGTRAACFFAGLCLVISQIGVNVPGNALAGGFDLAATFPKYLNIRRGAYITAIFSIVVNPWRLVNTATTFLTVLSSYSVFLAPMTGLMISSYLVVNKRKVNVDDLYRGDSDSIYWFSYGCNWRAPVAWLVGVVPCMPGFVAAVDTSVTVSEGATELYYMSYMYGLLSSGLVYAVLHKVFPAKALDSFVKTAPSAKELQEFHLGLFCKGRGLECTSSTPIDQTSDAAVGGRNHVHTTAGPSQPEFGHRQRPNSPGPAATPSAVEGPGPNTDGLWTLEDNANRTAHSMGPAAEQDTHVLDAIRSSVLSSADEVDADMIQVYGGSKYLWDPPVHFCLLQDEFAAHDNAARNAASSAIEGLVGQYGPILVRLYFKHIHPVLPVLSKVRFLRQYAVDKTKLPASLRGAVYALASVFDKKDPSLKGPFPFKQHQLADYATDSLQRELDSPNLAKLQASLLLLHVKPNDVDSIEHPRTWTSTAQAVATAQMIGLHQDAERWSIAPWEKSLRRKLWWATYVADVWSAVCHGNPPHIYPASFNTSDITMDDLRSDEEVPPELEAMIDPVSSGFQIATGARFLELVKVSQALREMIDCSFQVPRLRPPGPGEDGNTGRLLLLRDKLGDWDGLLPRCLAMPSPAEALGPSNNAPLHLAYYAYLVLLYRALMTPATKEAKMDSSSNLHRWFETAVRDFEGFLGLIEAVTPEDLQGFWGRHARSQLILCGNFLIYLFLLSPTNSDVDAVWGLIERFEASLQRLESQADEAAKLLIHPVALRVQSLFIQGVDLMRKSHSAGTASATASAV